MIADSSFLFALFVVEDELHDKAINLIESIYNNQIIIIDRVLEETFTVLIYKKGIAYALNVVKKLKENKDISFYNIDEIEHSSIFEISERFRKKISFVDYVIIYMCFKNNDKILSFDKELIKIIEDNSINK